MKRAPTRPRPGGSPGGIRNPLRTQEKLLAAGLREFSAKGLAGARVDAIVRRAGVNKRMLYHYFGDKDGLFSAVLRRKIAQREALLDSAPREPAETLTYWFDAACRDLDWYRLLGWEALQGRSRRLVQETYRRTIARRAVEHIRKRQTQGLLPRGLDPGHLLLALMGLTAYPLAFPQATRLVTGQSAASPAFQRARRGFLRRIARILRGERRS